MAEPKINGIMRIVDGSTDLRTLKEMNSLLTTINNYISGQAEYCLTSGGKMVNTGSTDNLFTTSQGGGKGHTHTLNSHTHNIPYTAVAVWKRTA